MHFTFQTQERNQLIQLGYELGRAIQSSGRAEPLIVGLDGNHNSGKSLIALAMDMAFNPDKYPEGINGDHNADALRRPVSVLDGFKKMFRVGKEQQKKDDLPVVFLNYCNISLTSQKSYDGRLRELKDSSPSSSVLIASNLLRTNRGEFNYESQGLKSDMLDMNIRVHGTPQNFLRKIEITAEDSHLYGLLQSRKFSL